MDDDERAWKQSMYEHVITDAQVKTMACAMIERSHVEGHPELGPGDLEAARRYLRACIRNMSVYELQMATKQEFAGLLARGAVGAARYRITRAAQPQAPALHSKRRRRRPPPDR